MRGDDAATIAAMAHPPSTSLFEDEFVASLHELFEERIPFNRVIGLRIGVVSGSGVTGHIAMRAELIGHDGHRRLHGGVISAALDALAGLAVMAAIGARHMDETPAQRMNRFLKISTIDLRVDYLRPATGAHFDLAAEVMRLGSRVASVRMSFSGADGRLLATGAAAYMIS